MLPPARPYRRIDLRIVVRGGRPFEGELPLHSYLRIVIAACLVAFAAVIGAGAVLVLPRAFERPLVAADDGPEAAVCRHGWLGRDRSCIARSETPPAVVTQTAAAVDTLALPAPPAAAARPASPADTPAARPQPAQPEIAQPEPAPSVPSATVAQAPAAAPPAPAAVPVAAAAPPASAAAPDTTSTMPSAAVAQPHKEPAAQPPKARRAAKPAARERARVAKRPAAREKTAKRSTTNGALNVVRGFGDNLGDIPVTSYAPDGSRRTIVIRPTSIQDVYYYSR
jgi:hypothetical protein